MTERVNFSDRDTEGLLLSRGNYQFTDDITGDDDPWTQIQVGGPGNPFPVTSIAIAGQATSPGSLDASPKNKMLWLDVRITPRGTGPENGTRAEAKLPLTKWKDGETNTIREFDKYYELKTNGRVDGNIFVRPAAEQGGTTLTAVDINVMPYGAYDMPSPLEAPVPYTNNLRNVATGTSSANTVNEIPASTLGYVECRFTQYGFLGDVRTSNQFGLNAVADIGNSPKYYWQFSTGDATGNLPWARVVHDGVVIASDIVCDEGDVLRVSRAANGTITYLKNGVVEATGSGTDTAAMRGDIQSTSINSRIMGIRMDIGAGEISPTFENLVNLELY